MRPACTPQGNWVAIAEFGDLSRSGVCAHAAGGSLGRRLPGDSAQPSPPADQYFWQAADGQAVFIDSLSARMLLAAGGGSVATAAPRVVAPVIEMQPLTQTAATRRRYRMLSHVPLGGASWQTCTASDSSSAPAVSRNLCFYFPSASSRPLHTDCLVCQQIVSQIQDRHFVSPALSSLKSFNIEPTKLASNRRETLNEIIQKLHSKAYKTLQRRKKAWCGRWKTHLYLTVILIYLQSEWGRRRHTDTCGARFVGGGAPRGAADVRR